MDMASNPISSRNDQPGVGEALGDEGNDTLLCLEDVILLPRRGNGAVNEKVEEGALSLLVEAWGSSVAMLNLKRQFRGLCNLLNEDRERKAPSYRCQEAVWMEDDQREALQQGDGCGCHVRLRLVTHVTCRRAVCP